MIQRDAVLGHPALHQQFPQLVGPSQADVFEEAGFDVFFTFAVKGGNGHIAARIGFEDGSQGIQESLVIGVQPGLVTGRIKGKLIVTFQDNGIPFRQPQGFQPDIFYLLPFAAQLPHLTNKIPTGNQNVRAEQQENEEG